MRVLRRTFRNRDGKQRTAKKWYVEVSDTRGHPRRLPAFVDKRASEEFGRRCERLVGLSIAGEQPDTAMRRWLEALPNDVRARLARVGVLDEKSVAATKPALEHLAEFRQSLEDSGATAEYVSKTSNRIKAVLHGAETLCITDLTADSVTRYLAGRRADGLSVKSSNHYLAAVKGFAGWLVKRSRLTTNPLDVLRAMNANADRRHVRRSLEVAELQRLISTTAERPDVFGMTGRERAMLYRLAAETGLRSGELRSLRPCSFDLGGAEPTVTIDAAAAKNGKGATLPLRPDTAERLRVFLGAKLPTASVFKMPRPEQVAIMLRRDLTAAGIRYRDDSGRVCDFHSLRVTFASLLLRSGVDVRTARDLMRHSTIAMTADVYACTMRGSQIEAVDRLPDLSQDTREEARATGTDDARSVCPDSWPESRTERCKPVRGDARSASAHADTQPTEKTGTYDELKGSAVRANAPAHNPAESPPRGIEPLLPA